MMTSILVKKNSTENHQTVMFIKYNKKNGICQTQYWYKMKIVTVWQHICHLLIFQHQHSTVQTCIDERGGRDDSDPLELRQRWSASSVISNCLSSAWEQTSAIGDFRFKLCRSDKMHLFQKSQGYFKTKLWTCFILNLQVFYTTNFIWVWNLGLSP
jgi:hypothetical protein